MKLKARILCGAAVALWATTVAHADNAADTDAATGIETVVVLGMGEIKQIQTISQPDMTVSAPGTSPIKVISKLPGVNFESADPYGAYEWAVRISVRGFNQNQMGFTLDDVPLGDMSYANHNGLHISRAISSENLGGADLSQGAGALGTASTSNLGGTLAFHSAMPRADAGVYVASSYGSDNTYHEFIRIDSGTLAGGGSGYISYGLQYGDKWKGDGTQKQQQINAKYVQPLGTLTLSGTFDYSMRRENDYQDLSLALIRRVGYNWDNISSNWQEALKIASTYQANSGGDCAAVGGGDGTNQYPSPVQCVDDAYYNASGLRNDALGAVTANWDIFSNLTFHVTAYGHNNKGMGTWDTPYVASPDGTPISMRTTEYGINRYGAVGWLRWTYEDHTIEAGYWYENNNFHQARRYYAMSADAPRGDLSFSSHAFATSWEYKFNTVTQVVHLQDTWQVSDALKVEFGFKAQKVNNVAHVIVGTISGKIGSENDFLPQVGANYTLDDHNEVFADYSENQRAFVGSATDGPFSTTQIGFDAIKGDLKPETSRTVEAGYRYNTASLQGVLTGYYVKFKNRLLTTTVGSGIVGNPSALANVGSVTTMGIEAAGTWHFANDMWLFGSYAFNQSTYDDDTYDGDGDLTARTKDKSVVDAPKHILKGELGYDNGSLFAHLNGSFLSRRYYTYTNDASVPTQTVFDLSFGYRIASNDYLNGVELQGNVNNLFDTKYISTIGTNGYKNTDPAGTFQTLMAGAPRQFFITLRKQF